MNQIYIPNKIKIGYRERNDTYTGKLAYIIYIDNKGVLRKETSWQNWRDKKIDPQDFDNEPTSGFVLNKGIERCNWSHFSTGRSYIRMYDPRGIEFEITVENLMYILMNCDCSNKGLSGEYVYGWWGKELVMVPVHTEEYKKAMAFTQLQTGKITKKDLIPGCIYETKKQEELVYLGKFDVYDRNYEYVKNEKTTKNWSSGSTEHFYWNVQKKHVFQDVEKKKHSYHKPFRATTSLTFLSKKISDDFVVDFADRIQEFNLSNQGGYPISAEIIPISDFKIHIPEKDNYYSTFEEEDIFLLENNFLSIIRHSVEKENGIIQRMYFTGYKVAKVFGNTIVRVNPDYRKNQRYEIENPDDISKKYNLVRIKMKLNNDLERFVKNSYDLNDFTLDIRKK